MGKCLFFFSSFLLVGVGLAAPSDSSFVVSSTEASNIGGKEDAKSDVTFQYPTIYEMDITSNISNRFATTLVVSKVKNVEKVAKQTTFNVIIPEKAFISEFVMEIEGNSYKAYVKEKEEAKKIYNQAVASGRSAAHVAVSARNSNRFTVSVNVEPESKVIFLLTYEELLERRNNQYELFLNIHPGQIVKNLNLKVQINETRPLKFVRTPSLRSGNEIGKNEEKLDPSSDIQIINSTAAVVKFNPDSENQKKFARNLGDKESKGLSGQFVVQYDVERDPHGGEVLLRDGYFVHFFAPTDLEPLPKHVLFVLDSSGSMKGGKIEQVKDAMNSILEEIRDQDVISIIDFGTHIYVWDILGENRNMIPLNDVDYENPFTPFSQLNLSTPIRAVKENIDKAKRITNTLDSFGGTFIIGGLETALYLAKVIQDSASERKYQPIIIFLTDGQPNIGLALTDEIEQVVTRLNEENNKIPIFSLSFGEEADQEFLRKLSLNNRGFSRHIYEASDASLQLQEFYKQISSPLLSNITFTYNNDVKDISKTKFPVFFNGSEIVVAGRYHVADSDFQLSESVLGWSSKGRKILQPTIERPVSSLERLWAYLTIKQTLDERDLTDNKTELTKKALDLALKYSFVTDITSLVVVKPNKTSAVNTEAGASFGRAYAKASGFQSFLTSTSSNTLTLAEKKRPIANPPPPVQSSADISHTGAPPTTNRPILNSLPWLASALNPNGTITVGEKTYELGETHTVTVPKPCPDKLGNSTVLGQCVLLKDCSEMYSIITDFQEYQKHFCSIGERYAGICCPKRVT